MHYKVNFLLDKEISARIRKATCSFGRLHGRVWNERGIKTSTKVKVYQAVVLTALLYSCETWVLYRRHLKELESVHARHLRKILRIKWQDMIQNTEVLRRAWSTSIEAFLIKAQLRWTGHVLRMEDGRLPKDLLYGELKDGSRHVGGQRKRFKDTLKRSLTVCNIAIDKLKFTAQDRMQ